MTNISFCGNCYAMTHSVRKAKLEYVCGKCGHDKTLSDIMQAEVKQ